LGWVACKVVLGGKLFYLDFYRLAVALIIYSLGGKGAKAAFLHLFLLGDIGGYCYLFLLF